MVLISDHIIIIHHLDVMLHIYITLEEIGVDLEANRESTSVMVKIDPNPPRWTKGAQNKAKKSRNLM